MVARSQVGGAPECEALAVGLHPALLAAEAVVAGHRADGAAADDQAGAELAEDRALGVVPRDVEGDAVLRDVGVVGVIGVEPETPLAEGLDELEAEGPDRHVHAVGGERLVRPHGGVAAPHVDDGEGFGGAEVRVEGEADDDQQLTDLVLAGEPHALVGLGVGGPHDADRGRGVVDRGTHRARSGVRARRRRDRARRRDGAQVRSVRRSCRPVAGAGTVVGVVGVVGVVVVASCCGR